jgi:YjbE family integral membrane protein
VLSFLDSPTLVAELTALAQVVFIDVALAGDNAVVVGLAVNGLPPKQKSRAIALGIGGATVIRIAFAAVALQLLAIIGLLLAGGILLLWVCWRMFRELRQGREAHETNKPPAEKSMREAMFQIILADVSMSLDNVLAVAGAAHEHPWVLVVGLVLSVILMGLGSALIARLLETRPWIAWAGFVVVLYVAIRMIWDGSHQVAAHLA